MPNLKSLTAKYVLLSILLLAFISGYVTADFVFTQQMKGVARRINLAGSERMLIVRISSHAHALAGFMTFADKEKHGKDILKTMAEYEDVLHGLRDGSEKLGVEPIRVKDKDSTSRLIALIELWENAQKPVLLGIEKDHAVKGKETCKACHAAIRDKTGMIDDFVASLERHHDKEIEQFDLFRFYALGLFLVMAIFIFLFAKKKLILPVRKLRAAVSEIDRGNFGVTVEAASSDEIGALSTSFNEMSRNLKSGFDENTRLVHEISSKKDDLDILNKISSALSSSLSVEDIVNRALDEVLNLERLRVDKKGAFFLADEKTRTLNLAAHRGFSEEFARLEATVPFGDCLCGLAAESGDCILSEDCFTDKRHTRRDPEMTGHGHINIPLKSRDKMLGVFCLYLSAQTKLSDEEKSFFQSIARIVSISLDNALNHRQVMMLAQSLDSSNDVIVITDINGGIIHVNPETTRQTGYSVDELVGRPVSIILSPHNPSGLGEEIVKKTFEGGWFGEAINRRKDGSEYPVLLTSSPVKDASGQVITLVGVARDITERKRAENAVRESEKRYKKMLDSVSDYIYTVKIEQGRLVSTTHGPACVTVTGYTSEEYEADPGLWYRMIYEEDRGIVLQHAGKTQSGQASSVIHRIKHKDGSIRWVARTAVPRFDEQHRLIAYDGIINDITGRKNAEDAIKRSNEEMLALADASNVILTVTAPGENLFETICDIVVRKFDLKMAWIGLIEHGSFDVKPIAQSGFEEGYLKTVKVTFDDTLTGMGPTGLAIKTLQQQVMNDITTNPRYAPWKEEALKRGYQASMAAPLLSAEGKLTGVLNIYSGNPGFFTRERIKLFQIFSNQAATAIENRGLIENLENKIVERTNELADAKDSAESANRAKSEFLANMSHELRTPLNAVLGFSEMMVKGMTGALSPKQTEYLKHINESGAHLLSLINDILDLSKVEAGKMDLEYKEIDVRYVVDRVLSLFKEKMMKHGMQLTVEIEAGIGSVCADERGIKQVLLNLMSNAVKFTPDGGAVRVSARRAGSSELRIRSEEINSKLDADFVEISVANSGPGIKAEDIPKLFKPFQQLDSSYEKKHQGTGLGLALCKRIVELHNGKIWVESAVDKETVFIFVIPITRPECSGPKEMGL